MAVGVIRLRVLWRQGVAHEGPFTDAAMLGYYRVGFWLAMAVVWVLILTGHVR